jgi:hypothetical protein
MSHWLFLLTMGNLFLVVCARAPDSICIDLPLIPAPIPSNAEILADSFNYATLLSNDNGSAWQQVDLDRNNMFGMATSVSFLFL